MSEMVPVEEGGSRLFIIIAVALVGLLIVGLVGIGGFVLFTRMSGEPTEPTPVAAATVTRTPAPTFTPTPSEATPTPTKVVGEGTEVPGETPAPGATPTTAPSTGEIPETGFGPLEAFLVGLGLVVAVVVARKFRLGTRGGGGGGGTAA